MDNLDKDFGCPSRISLVKASKIKGPFVQRVLDALDPASGEVLTIVKKSVLQEANFLLEFVPPLTDVLIETIADKCAEGLKQAKGITATYLMTNKPMPTRHSPYVSSVLQPLKTFLEGNRIIYLGNMHIRNYFVKKIATQCSVQAQEVIDTARKTEINLLRLRQGAARQRGARADSNEHSISGTDKISAQLFLDVQEFGRQLLCFRHNRYRIARICITVAVSCPTGQAGNHQFLIARCRFVKSYVSEDE